MSGVRRGYREFLSRCPIWCPRKRCIDAAGYLSRNLLLFLVITNNEFAKIHSSERPALASVYLFF